jgi:hypothetical protein
LDNYLDNYQKSSNIKTWQVRYSREGVRYIKDIPAKVKEAAYTLVRELKFYGPYRANWKIIDKKERILEVYYVGTHEKAPY